MEHFFTTLAEINDKINAFIWVKIGLVLLIGTGILMTCCTKWFQITHLKHWWQQTIGGVFRRDSGVHAKTDKKTISQFQALCTALAATIGTGNIAGVSAAIVIGGPGAVFWMWIAAFFGMMTNFSENVLGIYYRRRNSQGEWSGGAMYYLRDGLGGRKHCKTIGSVLAVLFSIFAILASFGIGNMGQINKIVLNMKSAFFGGVTATVGGVSVVSLGCGIVLMILAALIVIGGLQRIATVAERVVPFMAVLYIIGALVVFFTNIGSVGAMFAAIFRFAFGSKAVAGGAAGIAIQQAITQGCKRGVFSNEAGLGSSVMVHSSSNVKEPVTQGMWGIFEVFFATLLTCTLTALVILVGGVYQPETVLSQLRQGMLPDWALGVPLTARSFSAVLGEAGAWIVWISLLLFAFSSILGWSYYGQQSLRFLTGGDHLLSLYRAVFLGCVVLGACGNSAGLWQLVDLCNALMAIPNLLALLLLAPQTLRLLRQWVQQQNAPV